MKSILNLFFTVLITSCQVSSSFSIRNNTSDTLIVVDEELTPKDDLYKIYFNTLVINPYYKESQLNINYQYDSINEIKTFYILPNKTCVLAQVNNDNLDNTNDFVISKKIVVMSKKDTISATYKNIMNLFTKTKPNSYVTSYELIINK